MNYFNGGCAMREFIKKAEILVEALPYIKKFYGKTAVIKYGGNAMVSNELKNSVMEDITLLKYIGMNPIVVHGGGPDISNALKTYQIDSEFVNGLRVTDRQTMEIAQMVLIGKTNKEIVSLLNVNGGNAVGISGIDSNLFMCEKHNATVGGIGKDLGFVGDITEVNCEIVEKLSNNGYIPIIAPIGVDENGQSYNINADTAAGALAGALKAEKLILLTDIEGIKHDVSGDSIIYETEKSEILKLIDKGVITTGMLPKVLGCINAIDSGVERVHIIDGRIPHCLLLEIFTNTGIGTMIKK
jgi:acetylglutamate kinase